MANCFGNEFTSTGRTLKRASLSDMIFDKISEAILSGEYAKDSRIGTKADLQNTYGVAPGTVNEVVRMLSARNLIELRPGPKGGLFAAEPSAALKFGELVIKLQHSPFFSKDCFEMKDILDPWVSADAARHRTATDVRELRVLLEKLESAPNLKIRVSQNWKLHRRIAQISKNHLLVIFYMATMDLLEKELVEVTVPSETNETERSATRNELHRALVDAIEAGDVAKAWQYGGEKHKFPIHAVDSGATLGKRQDTGSRKKK
jgi:DNA-binding FadR family transcriptional regulator